MSNEQQSVKMWSGRFREPLDSEFEAWQRSIVFDWRLLEPRDSCQQGACIALGAAGMLTSRLKQRSSARRWTQSPPNTIPTPAKPRCATMPRPKTFITLSSSSWWSGSVRSASSCTPAAAATNRSPPICGFTCARNRAVIEGLAAWARALVEKARAAGDAVMPSYTHLQRAEPVLRCALAAGLC